jgi:hypothetical protein
MVEWRAVGITVKEPSSSIKKRTCLTVESEVLAAVKMNSTIFWAVTP